MPFPGDGPIRKPGDEVAVRNTKDGVVVWATVMRVVQDEPDLLALYLGIGTPFWVIGDEQGELTRDFRKAHHLVERTWGIHEFLYLIEPGDAHAKCVAWRMPERKFVGWYINLQRPMTRTAIGFESLDHTLDVQIAPDLKRWQWKDEDELQDRVDAGRYAPEHAAAIRAEGERVVAQMKAGYRTFTAGWDRWAPPREWTVPLMPAGWESAGGTRLFGPDDRWA